VFLHGAVPLPRPADRSVRQAGTVSAPLHPPMPPPPVSGF